MVKIGSFSAAPDAPRFHNTGPIGGYLIVFPRVPVFITHAGGSPITATPNRVMFYNHEQEYRRDRLSPQGDQSHWFGFCETVVRDLLLPEPGYTPVQERILFHHTHGPVDAASYARQRLLVEYLFQHPQPDPLLVEETALSILAAVLHSTRRAWQGASATRAVKRNSPEKAVAAEMTVTPTRCAGCGREGEVGSLHVYGHGPGIVLRCPACQQVVLRIVRTPQAIYVDARGAIYLSIPM